jgi:hypothetical protein
LFCVRQRHRAKSAVSFHDSLFFKACDALVEVTDCLFQRCHGSDERTEGDLHIVEIGAHQVEDICHCLEAGVNFVVESIETLPECEELLLGQGGKLVY